MTCFEEPRQKLRRPHAVFPQMQHLSFRRRVGLVTASVILCLFTAGIIFGYARTPRVCALTTALRVVLESSGVYHDSCPGLPTDTICEAQVMRLSLLFSVAASLTNVRAPRVWLMADLVSPHRHHS